MVASLIIEISMHHASISAAAKKIKSSAPKMAHQLFGLVFSSKAFTSIERGREWNNGRLLKRLKNKKKRERIYKDLMGNIDR